MQIVIISNELLLRHSFGYSRYRACEIVLSGCRMLLRPTGHRAFFGVRSDHLWASNFRSWSRETFFAITFAVICSLPSSKKFIYSILTQIASRALLLNINLTFQNQHQAIRTLFHYSVSKLAKGSLLIYDPYYLSETCYNTIYLKHCVVPWNTY